MSLAPQEKSHKRTLKSLIYRIEDICHRLNRKSFTFAADNGTNGIEQNFKVKRQRKILDVD